MRIVVALGGNALLRRGEPLTAEAQRTNVKVAAASLAAIYPGNELVITHGNGPQVGLLALQAAAYKATEHIARLKGEPNSWRRRVGNYRIFFDVDPVRRVIDIIEITRRTSTTY